MRVPALLKASVRASALAGTVATLGWVAPACGASSNGVFTPGTPDAGAASNGGNADLLDGGGFSLDALAAADPPNQWCGPDADAPAAPPALGGSPDCPSDKNLEGCPCSGQGVTAACWPGLRANRDVGDCKDGTTTCQMTGEVGYTWGPCVGAVLPDPNATTAAAACSCFSEGQWHIDNLVPYFITYGDAGPTIALSTSQAPDGGEPVFPVVNSSTPDPPPMPTASWSSDELTVDCAGTFTLCYELKYGDFNNPLPTDCSIAKVCLPATYYATADVSQAFPPLPPWEATAAQSSCAVSFHENGGYGEMSVLGESVLCQKIDDGAGKSFVFHRIQYCPASNTSCGQDGSGTFE